MKKKNKLESHMNEEKKLIFIVQYNPYVFQLIERLFLLILDSHTITILCY